MTNRLRRNLIDVTEVAQAVSHRIARGVSRFVATKAKFNRVRMTPLQMEDHADEVEHSRRTDCNPISQPEVWI